MEVTGNVYKIFGKQQISEKFAKRELVIETNDQCPQKLLIQFVNDKCDLLDSVLEGEQVSIGINLNGREWTNPQGEMKFFNTIVGWRISNVNNGFDPKNKKEDYYKETMNNDIPESHEEDDDLPF